MPQYRYNLFLNGKLTFCRLSLQSAINYMEIISNDQWRVIEIKGEAIN